MDQNPTENLWNDMKIAVHQQQTSKLSNFEQRGVVKDLQIHVWQPCKQLSKNMVIAVKGATTKYWLWGVYTLVIRKC